jgi:hypothetical protein
LEKPVFNSTKNLFSEEKKFPKIGLGELPEKGKIQNGRQNDHFT